MKKLFVCGITGLVIPVLLTSCGTPGGLSPVSATSAGSATEAPVEVENSTALAPPPEESKPEYKPRPPKPSLAKLTNKDRQALEFFGAKIYADSIVGTEATGNVYLDGSELHGSNRSFPVAVYADQVKVDLIKGEVLMSGWPIVKTDSAYVQAESPETTILLSRDSMSKIDGPARYVIGVKGDDLFGP